VRQPAASPLPRPLPSLLQPVRCWACLLTAAAAGWLTACCAALAANPHTGPQPEGAAPRPVTFLFNGGPGSSSIWLHLGGIGPQRVALLPDGGQVSKPHPILIVLT